MSKLFTFFAISMAFLVSCSTVSEVTPNAENNTPTSFDFNGTEWRMVDCPDNPFLVLHGLPECDFFSELKWTSDEDVMIYHNTRPDPTTYHICQTDGSKMSVSIQECANLTWRSLFEFNVTSVNENTLVFNLEAENLAPSYSERMEFTRAN